MCVQYSISLHQLKYHLSYVGHRLIEMNKTSHSLYRLTVDLGTRGLEAQGDTLEGVPIHSTAHKHTSGSVICMSLDCGKKNWRNQRIPTTQGKTCKLHAQPQGGGLEHYTEEEE